MVFKKVCVIGLSVLATLALAQATFIEGAHGQGRARNAAGKFGNFRFEVVRYRTAGNEIQIRGSWTFAGVGTSATDRFEIRLLRLHELAVEEHTAIFAGRAVLVHNTPNGVVRKEGGLTCRVVDKRRPATTGEPDAFGFKFRADNNGPIIEWAGLVVDGDLVVKDEQKN